MLINSELPLTMLDKNLELNEYDFVLFHLCKQYPEYKDYYKQLRQSHPDRLMILDNSAYEFFVKGETLDVAEYIDLIQELAPDMYILPDVLMDKQATLDGVFNFMLYNKIKVDEAFRFSKAPQPLAVAQGNSAEDLFDCLLKYWYYGIKNVAIPFHNSFYKDYHGFVTPNLYNTWRLGFGQLTEDHKYAIGRIEFVRAAALLLKKFEYVHLLGSHCPWEKAFHPMSVQSIDTGYPVKCGIEGHELFKEPAKPDIIIDDFMTEPLTEAQITLIENNIKKFKSLY